MATPNSMPIAIIGMSCRFSGGVTSPELLWQLLSTGGSGWSTTPKNRFNGDSFFHPDSERTGSNHVKGAHFLREDIRLFDAPFFNLSVDTAAAMDPQIRLQLESAYEAFENAGLPLSKLAGSDTAVFSGQFTRDYADALMRDPETLPKYYLTGNGAAMVSARISHFFDLRGPCMTIDTGCSTGLTALYQACQSLRCEEASMAVVTGSSLLLNPESFNQMSSTGFLSSEGRSFSFDNRGTGYGRGEGVATLVIKPLEAALRDNDPIRAVIRGTALNQDGRTPTITCPSIGAQEALIRLCYKRAGLKLHETPYLEAHGTGTKTGDPIEATAVHATLGNKRHGPQPLLIGSIKSNVGHCEAASALGGVIKVALAFEKGMIPPNYDFRTPNPEIPIDAFKMKVVTNMTAWPDNLPRRASINSFGYGGTNGHAILEEPAIHKSKFCKNGNEDDIGRWRIFRLSAKDEAALGRSSAQLQAYLRSVSGVNEAELLRDLAYTLDRRRSIFAWSTAVTAQTRKGLIDALKTPPKPVSQEASRPRLGFVFTGQGAQWHAMGKELIAHYPVFRDSILEADQTLKDLGCTWSATEELTKNAESTRVNETVFSLPLCLVVQISLVRLLKSWGIDPTAVTGHSSGEVAAAFAANANNLKEALSIVCTRGVMAKELQEKTQRKGGMLAAGISREEAQLLLEGLKAGKAVVACINSPSSVTFSGDIAAIEELENKLNAASTFARRLKVGAAYHSNHMEVFADAYNTALEECLSNSGDFNGVIFSSSTTGSRITRADELNAAYWVKNMVQPVEFVDSFTQMCIDSDDDLSNLSKKAVDIVIEIGPHGALAGPIRQILQTPNLSSLGIRYTSCLTRNQDAVMTMQSLACFLIAHGYPVDIDAANFPTNPSPRSVLTDLPSYPWNHQTPYWCEPRLNRQYRLREHPYHDLLGIRIPGLDPRAPAWRHFIRQNEIPWTKDHRLQSTVVYPAAGYICMAIEGVRQLVKGRRSITGYELRDVRIGTALIIPNTKRGVEAQLHLTSCYSDQKDSGDACWEFWISSVTENDVWKEHCCGFISAATLSNEWTQDLAVANGTDLEAHCEETIDPEALFQSLHNHGIELGPSFRNLTDIKIRNGQVLASLKPRNTVLFMPKEYEGTHVLHPTTLDSIIVSAFSGLPKAEFNQSQLVVPHAIERLYVRADASDFTHSEWQIKSRILESNSRGFSSSSTTFASDEFTSSPLIDMQGLSFLAVGKGSATGKNEAERSTCSMVRWERDVSFLDTADLLILPDAKISAVEEQMLAELNVVAVEFARRALKSLDATDITQLNSHYRFFYEWLVSIFKDTEKYESAAPVAPYTRDIPFEKLIAKVKARSVSGEVLCKVGEHLTQILQQQVAPLDLVNERDLLRKFHENDVAQVRSQAQLRAYLKLYAHKRPRAKVIQLSVGTPAYTEMITQTLGGIDTSKKQLCSDFDFTSFPAWADSIISKAFNVDLESIEALFELASYDLIILHNPLPAMPLTPAAVDTFRKLLNPTSTMIVIENNSEEMYHDLIFGTLPGWSHAWRSRGEVRPTISIERRDIILQDKGSRVLETRDSVKMDEGRHTTESIVSTALPRLQTDVDADISIIYSASQPPEAWTHAFKTALSKTTSLNVGLQPLNQADPVGTFCIFLEITSPELSDPSLTTYNAIQNMLLKSKGILWVTRGAAMECEQPMFTLSHGLLRTLRLEYRQKQFVSLDLDSSREVWTIDDVTAIVNVAITTLRSSASSAPIESEYAERKGVLHVPRILEFENGSKPYVTDNQQTKKRKRWYPCHEDRRSTTVLENRPGDQSCVHCQSTQREINAPASKGTARLSPDFSYLIVGGMGGIGQSISRLLVQLGARKLILLSRNARGKMTSSTVFLNELEIMGCKVYIQDCDVTSKTDLQRAIQVAEKELDAPIRGVVQAAMSLRDMAFERMSHTDFMAALHPKVLGTWNLHEAFESQALSFFTILSSLVGLSGNGGQANYAAGGAFEDALARHRSARGLPAVVIDLGAVKGIGYLAEHTATADRLNKMGYKSLNEREVLGLVEQSLATPLRDPLTSQVVVGTAGCEWGKTPWANDARFEALKPVRSASTNLSRVAEEPVELQIQLSKTVTAEEAIGIVVDGVAREISHIFSIAETEIDKSAPLSRYGVDSLVAVELRNWLNEEMGTNISIFDIMQSSTLFELAEKAIVRSERFVNPDNP